MTATLTPCQSPCACSQVQAVYRLDEEGQELDAFKGIPAVDSAALLPRKWESGGLRAPLGGYNRCWGTGLYLYPPTGGLSFFPTNMGLHLGLSLEMGADPTAGLRQVYGPKSPSLLALGAKE